MNSNHSKKQDKLGAENKKGLDKELAQSFQHLRKQEKALLPRFPSEEELRQRQPVNASKLALFEFIPFEYMPRIAATFVVVAFTGFLVGSLINQQHEDPTEIYTQIMETHYGMSTDELLIVSESLSPEIIGNPDFYNIDMDIEFEPELYTN